MSDRHKQIPFVDLGAQTAPLREEIREAIDRVVADASFILGPDLLEFEEAFSQYTGATHCVGVASGLDALALALRASGVGPGDEVITVANTFVATALSIRSIGARPVLVDCSERDYNVDPDLVESAITPRTRVIVPVHLYGRLAQMSDILAIGDRNRVVVIEDAAQAHGARRSGVTAGSFGRAAAFSFYPSKNLGCLGDGGAITTSDSALADDLRVLRNYGQSRKNYHIAAATNSRLDTLQAAVLNVKLRHLDRWNESRRQAARHYAERLRGSAVQLPVGPSDPEAHVHHLFVVRVKERDRVRDRLLADGVHTGIHYPLPIHLQPAFADLGYGPGDFPVAERFAGEVLSLPMYAGITEAQVDHVCDALLEAAS